MLTWILVVLAALIVLFVVIVALQPADFRIERRGTMAAPAEAVFEQVNDLRKWQAWSPWERMDPNLQRTYGDPSAGMGASYAWAGNKQVGEGRMTIIESRPGELIRIKLEFLKPFKATNIAEIAFEPRGDQTAVTWSMTGARNFAFKAFGLFMNMDKMIGGDFEKGLSNLKSVVELTHAL